VLNYQKKYCYITITNRYKKHILKIYYLCTNEIYSTKFCCKNYRKTKLEIRKNSIWTYYIKLESTIRILEYRTMTIINKKSHLFWIWQDNLDWNTLYKIKSSILKKGCFLLKNIVIEDRI
jgi:hypothetical protein